MEAKKESNESLQPKSSDLQRQAMTLGLTKREGVSYIGNRLMEEKEEQSPKVNPEEEKKREVDLNALFPGRDYDLNYLFPDEGTKKLLYELKRNKREIERFIKNLQAEEE